MEYLIPALLVILLVAGFVTFLVLNATRRSSSNPRGEDGPPGIGTDDNTPLGDTAEHAGRQTSEGTTVGGQDAEVSGGSGRPVHSGSAGTSHAGADRSDPDAAAHIGRPGEGEGAKRLEFEGRQPRRS